MRVGTSGGGGGSGDRYRKHNPVRMIAGSWEVMIIYLAALIPRPCGGAGRGVLADREAARM